MKRIEIAIRIACQIFVLSIMKNKFSLGASEVVRMGVGRYEWDEWSQKRNSHEVRIKKTERIENRSHNDEDIY